MGKVSERRIIILIFCFLLTGVFIYWSPSAHPAKKKTTLSQTLNRVSGWQTAHNITLEKSIIEALDLDDYINTTFYNDQHRVFLYIGYYLSSNKVGAAHSPLVCFPGQGWVLSKAEKKVVEVGEQKIELEGMVATTGDRKELLLYWFQAFDKTSPGTLLQKINTLWAKYVHQREDNAFVRVTVPMEGLTVDEAYMIGLEFIRAFYPYFLDYVKQDVS